MPPSFLNLIDMKNILLAIAASAIFGLMSQKASAQPNTDFRPDMTVYLYADTDAAPKGDPVYGKVIKTMGLNMKEENGLSGDETLGAGGELGNISDFARVDLYLPENPNGQMIVICPGGSYSIVSSYNEGVYVAKWLDSLGIAAAVVKYRLPNGHCTVPLEDVHNVFRYCRDHAEEFGVKQIGVMGFSAGGHLAASATTLYTDEATRPDFSILIYPVIAMDEVPSHTDSRFNLIGKNADSTLRKYYSLYTQVTPDTPPVFLAHCTDDGAVPVINSIVFYNALVDNHVSAEMHIYPVGNHGWGGSTSEFVENDRIGYARSEYETSLARWLATQRESIK